MGDARDTPSLLLRWRATVDSLATEGLVELFERGKLTPLAHRRLGDGWRALILRGCKSLPASHHPLKILHSFPDLFKARGVVEGAEDAILLLCVHTLDRIANLQKQRKAH